MIKLKGTHIALVGATILLVGLASNIAKAGIWDSVVTGNWDTIKSNAFKVEAHGQDFRVYEYSTKGGALCNIVVASEGPVGVSCITR